MKRVFKQEDGKMVDPISHTIDILSKHPDVKIYIGTDSQNKRHLTCYVTSIAYRYGHRGAHFIYWKENTPRIKDRWTRLWGEVERSVEIANLLEDNSIKIYRVDLDFNEKEIAKSSNMVSAARGYVIGMGFSPDQVTVKPNEQVATRSSDHICRR